MGQVYYPVEGHLVQQLAQFGALQTAVGRIHGVEYQGALSVLLMGGETVVGEDGVRGEGLGGVLKHFYSHTILPEQ